MQKHASSRRPQVYSLGIFDTLYGGALKIQTAVYILIALHNIYIILFLHLSEKLLCPNYEIKYPWVQSYNRQG